MKKTATPSYLRTINQRLALEAVYEKGPISKAQLSRLLHSSKPAMADNTAKLLSMGIIEEIDAPNGANAVGRKPVLLQFNQLYRYIVTIDFNYQKSIFNLFDLRGETINQFTVHQAPHQNFKSWLDMSVNAVSALLLSQGIGAERLAAIGICSPGIINADQSSIINGPMFGSFNPKSLYDTLVAHYRCPVYIKNSANASALGEWSKGAGRGTENMLYVSCGQGLGTGIITNGKLYEGTQVAAGEVAGFVTPETCELSSTLEDRICIAGLMTEFKKHGGTSFEEFVRLWENGDVFAVRCVDEIFIQLGCLICNLVMTLNCELVVIGGDYLAFKSQMIPYIGSLVKKKCIIPAAITSSYLQDSASSIGMAAICREMYFDRLCCADTAEQDTEMLAAGGIG